MSSNDTTISEALQATEKRLEQAKIVYDAHEKLLRKNPKEYPTLNWSFDSMKSALDHAISTEKRVRENEDPSYQYHHAHISELIDDFIKEANMIICKAAGSKSPDVPLASETPNDDVAGKNDDAHATVTRTSECQHGFEIIDSTSGDGAPNDFQSDGSWDLVSNLSSCNGTHFKA